MSDKQNKRLSYLNVLHKIRNFLLCKSSREFLIFLFFVFVSFSFWLLQVLNDDYETELAIPVKMKNVPENVVVTSDIPSELRVRVKDRGTVLVNYMLGQIFYPMVIDFVEYAYKGNHVQIPSTILTKRITGQLNQSTKILTIKPDTLEFIYTQGKGKKVPVKLQGTVKAERQYYISDIVYSPDSVMVYAPRHILDTLTTAYTNLVAIENITDSIHRRLDILPLKGVRFVPSYSDVIVMADVFSEKTVEVPVRGVGFPKDKVLRTFPSKVQVSFQVGLKHFKEVTADDFSVEVDYKDLVNGMNEKCSPTLNVLSPYVNHARMNIKDIDFIIEQQTVAYE